MRKKITGLVTITFLLISVTANGQDSNYNFTVQTLGGYTTPDVVPFWLRSNQFGSIPLDGASLSLIGAARKDYDLSADKLFDWGASFEGRANLGQGSNLTLIEGYGKLRFGIFEIRAGRSKKTMGILDTTLSTGSFSISGNALGIPEIEVSIQDYYSIPAFGHFLAFKGNFSNGYMGQVLMRRPGMQSDTVLLPSFFHQKSLYARLGPPNWRIKLYGGFNHQVQWGSEKDYYLEDFSLSDLKSYLYVLSGKRYNSGSIQETRLGNHLGTIDLGIEYQINYIRLLLYRQTFYDTGVLYHFANIQDGLNGISIRNSKNNRKIHLDKLTLEFLYTKNQAGEPFSPHTSTPYEPYYNHGRFILGWSYVNSGMGTPLITSKIDARSDLPKSPREYFINNRLYAFHLGCQGSLYSTDFIIKLTRSSNFGTYWTTDEEQTTDIPNPGAYGIFGKQNQFSTYFELMQNFDNNFNLGFVGAFDFGNLLYNSFGILFKASHSFVL